MKHRRDFVTGSPDTVTRRAPKRKDTAQDDELSIMGLDHEVTLWLRGGRKGARPNRRIEK